MAHDTKGKWVEDIKAAHRYARTVPRLPKYPPDYIRCDYFNDKGERCVLKNDHGDGHKSGQ